MSESVDYGAEMVEHVSIIEYNEAAEEYGETPGDRRIISGVQRDWHVRDDARESFVEIAEAVAIIELYGEISEDEVTDWCNSPAGKLALAHWFDHTDPQEVVFT